MAVFLVAGNKSRFAIEIEIEDKIDRWVYGTFFFWINGNKLGDPEDSADLNSCIRWMASFLESPPDLLNEAYFDMSLQDLDSCLGDFRTLGSEDIKYYVDHIGMSSFDRFKDMLLLIKNAEGIERLVCKSTIQKLQEIYLNAEEFEQVLKEIIAKYKQIEYEGELIFE